MLSKCANPDCQSTLHYLREGKVFKIEADAAPFLVNGPKPVKKVEHFWLCGRCSENWTLLYDKSAASVVVSAKPPMVRRAAAS
jgi:hypothetical protein